MDPAIIRRNVDTWIGTGRYLPSAALGPMDRLAGIIVHDDGEEIAGSLGISLGTVKSLHFKAIQNLRALMEPYLGCRT